jgi:hypothetical protein
MLGRQPRQLVMSWGVLAAVTTVAAAGFASHREWPAAFSRTAGVTVASSADARDSRRGPPAVSFTVRRKSLRDPVHLGADGGGLRLSSPETFSVLTALAGGRAAAPIDRWLPAPSTSPYDGTGPPPVA